MGFFGDLKRIGEKVAGGVARVVGALAPGVAGSGRVPANGRCISEEI